MLGPGLGFPPSTCCGYPGEPTQQRLDSGRAEVLDIERVCIVQLQVTESLCMPFMSTKLIFQLPLSWQLLAVKSSGTIHGSPSVIHGYARCHQSTGSCPQNTSNFQILATSLRG